MDTVLKIMLSSTIIPVINFVFKTVTASKFDNLFIPKYQKALQMVCMFIIWLLVYIGYGAFFSVLYHQVKEMKYTAMVEGSIYLIYIFGFMFLATTCLVKFWIAKKNGKVISIAEKKLSFMVLTLIILNQFIYSMMLHDMVFTSGLSSFEYVGNIIICIGEFFFLTYILLKAQLYIQGYKKREWGYALVPTPEDVNKKYLNVLYSISPTQLVLSEESNNANYPTNIYLYDVTKQSFIHFERVLNIK
ncbi:hypothetical protein ACFQ88_22440 [Paenibacillus sp. NPDC056579]|uniref:hypothetical protein n=1 Tax=Paenibacillus sp. NPDC056579 TaxID=3345871 RepID=UPI00368E1B29